MSLKQSLLSLTPKIVPVKLEDGTEVFVRSMTGADRDKIKSLQVKLSDSGRETEVDTHIVLACACEADGTRLFNAADFANVNQLPADVITQIALAAIKVSFVTAAEVDELKNG